MAALEDRINPTWSLSVKRTLTTPIFLSLSALALTLVVSVAVADEPASRAVEQQATASNQTDEVKSESSSETTIDLVEIGIPEPSDQCGNCSGTLGFFLDPSCICPGKEDECALACEGHGGVEDFHCGNNELYCECQDGAYDDCGCVNPRPRTSTNP